MHANLKAVFPELKKNVPAKELTTFQVGGTVPNVLEVFDTQSFVDVLKKVFIYKIPFTVIAGGSNVVFPDDEYCKLVVHIKNGGVRFSGTYIYADAGMVLDDLIQEAVNKGLSGLETLSGIPGSVGGAIVGNAGAYGKSISDSIVSIEYFDGTTVKTMLKNEATFSYRESIFKKKPFVALSALFLLHEKNTKELQETREKIISLRSKKYKQGVLCPGSFFKNILVSDLSEEQLQNIPHNKIIEGKVPSGYLLEEIGACKEREGDIYVAPFHGNLFINEGAGTAQDVYMLSQKLRKKVYKKFGICLENEVRFLASDL